MQATIEFWTTESKAAGYVAVCDISELAHEDPAEMAIQIMERIDIEFPAGWFDENELDPVEYFDDKVFHNAEDIVKALSMESLSNVIQFCSEVEAMKGLAEPFILWCNDNHICKDFDDASNSFIDRFVGIYKDYAEIGREFIGDAQQILKEHGLEYFFDYASYGESLKHGSYIFYELDNGKIMVVIA